MVHKKHHHGHHRKGHHHDGSSHKHQEPDENQEPDEKEIGFPCRSNHGECKGKYKSKDDVEWNDGGSWKVTWQPCRKQEAREYIEKYRSRPDEGEAQDTEQNPQRQQAGQPQEPQDAAAGPSSAQQPTAGAQPVAQQQADPSGGGNMTPGPFGQPIQNPGAPPLSGQPMPFAQGIPGNEGMGYAPGSQYRGGIPGTQGMGYPQGAPFPDGSYAGEYGGMADMPPDEMYEGGQDVGYPEEYDGGENMSFAGGPGGNQGGLGPGSTVPAPVEPPREQWVPHRPEYLYHPDETDGIAKAPRRTVHSHPAYTENQISFIKYQR